MRTHPDLQLTGLALAAVVLAGCSHAQRASAAAPSPSASPAPLRSCETRIMVLDGVQAVVTSNVDGTLAAVDVVHAPSAAVREKAVDDAIHYFGAVRRDTRVMQRQGRWGLSMLTDPCGRPVAATPSSSPSPKPRRSAPAK